MTVRLGEWNSVHQQVNWTSSCSDVYLSFIGNWFSYSDIRTELKSHLCEVMSTQDSFLRRTYSPVHAYIYKSLNDCGSTWLELSTPSSGQMQ